MSELAELREIAAYWQRHAQFYKDLAVRLKHENQYLRENTAENCRINSITHKDKTGETAIQNVTRDQKKRK